MMSDKVNEQLSALMDNECATPELALALRRLDKDHELKERWQRYHLISDTLKNNLPDMIETKFSERIRSEIESESTLPASVRSGWTNYLPLAGWSAAASVALLLGVGFSGVWSDIPTTNGTEVVAVTPSQITSDLTTVPLRDVSDAVEEQSPVDWNARLNNYLVSHNSVRGVVPYVYQVNYTSDR